MAETPKQASSKPAGTKQPGSQSGTQPVTPKPGTTPPKPAKPTSSGVDPVLEKLLANSAQATQEPCPVCKAFLKPGAELCVSCGYNKTTGKNLSTRVTREKAVKEKSLENKRSVNPVAVFIQSIPWPVSFVVFGAIVLVPLGLGLFGEQDQTMLAIGFVAALVVGVFAWISMAIAAFQEGVGRGIMLMVLSFLPVLGGYVVFWLFSETDRTHTKSAYAVVFLANLMFTFSQFGTSP